MPVSYSLTLRTVANPTTYWPAIRWCQQCLRFWMTPFEPTAPLLYIWITSSPSKQKAQGKRPTDTLELALRVQRVICVILCVPP